MPNTTSSIYSIASLYAPAEPARTNIFPSTICTDQPSYPNSYGEAEISVYLSPLFETLPKMISVPLADVVSNIAVTFASAMQSLMFFTRFARGLPIAIEVSSVETILKVAEPFFISSMLPALPPPFPSPLSSGSTAASQLSHLPLPSVSTCSVQGLLPPPQAASAKQSASARIKISNFFMLIDPFVELSYF